VLYLSFLIRLWREPSLPAPELTPDWHAEIEHIQSGQRWTFDTLHEVLEFLRSQVETLALGQGERGGNRLPLKTG